MGVFKLASDTRGGSLRRGRYVLKPATQMQHNLMLQAGRGTDSQNPSTKTTRHVQDSDGSRHCSASGCTCSASEAVQPQASSILLLPAGQNQLRFVPGGGSPMPEPANKLVKCITTQSTLQRCEHEPSAAHASWCCHCHHVQSRCSRALIHPHHQTCWHPHQQLLQASAGT